MRIPVNQPYRITTKFGVPDSYAKFGKHSGIDYAVAKDAPVYAPVSGVVTYAKYHNTGGNMLMIQDDNGNYHRLMHNNKLLVSYGNKVKEGQQVAKAGTTGLSTGVHVHWDIAKQQFPTSFNQFIDPNEYLKEEEVTSKSTAIMLVRTLTHEHNPKKAIWQNWVGLTDKELEERLKNVYEADWFKEQTAKIKGTSSIAQVKDKIINFVKGVK